MLSWLAGAARPNEDPASMDASQLVAEPDTPAHVFAARAFKYRLWGTPKPGAMAPSTQMNSDDTKTEAIKTSDHNTLSPSKPNGILLTPGTANLRRTKSVTFGADEANTTARRHSEGDYTAVKEVPGKFPTPSKVDIHIEPQATDRTKRTTLTEKLYLAKSAHPAKAKPEGPRTNGSEVATEQPAGGRTDWESCYHDYASRTEREMKKLIAKQQAAKRFAREKDTHASELTVQLHSEQKKVQRLEFQVATLNGRLEALLVELGAKQTEIAKKSSPLVSRRASAIELTSSGKKTGRPSHDSGDIWAEAMKSSPMTPLGKSKTLVRPQTAHQATANPLQVLDINALQARSSNRTPSPNKHSSRRRGTDRPPQRLTTETPAAGRTLDDSLPLPLPSPDVPAPRASHGAAKKSPQQRAATAFDAAPQSSPFITTPPKYDRMALPYSFASPVGRGPRTRVSPARQMREGVAPAAQGKGGAAAAREASGEAGMAQSPRKVLDEERRAQAAARIAARRRAREQSKLGGL